jgi:hypothetical protein
MASAFANVSGTVFKTDHREGVGKESKAPYSMDIIHVLVPNGGLTELTLPDPVGADALAALQGEEVDVTIEIFRNKYGFGTRILQDNLGNLAALAPAAAA